MIKEFGRFVGNRVLGWFLTHPTATPNINELARELEVSPGSVKRYADLFAREGILGVTRIGTAHLLALDNEQVVVRELKRTCMVLLLREAGVTGIAPGSISLAVYGSVAEGTYDERSDIDVLVIGEEGDVDYGRVPAIEAAVGHELQVSIVPYYRWEAMKQAGDAYARSVLARHILFKGAAL